jgi:hypothetical protein
MVAAVMLALFTRVPASTETLPSLLDRTQSRVQKLVELFSDVKCTERVTQEKLGKNGKPELRGESTYDYLAIFTDAGGELTLNESRLAVQQPKPDKKNVSLLVSNGFATLFLIFHPYYTSSFEFTDGGSDLIAGRAVEKIHFQHVPGTRSPIALAVRGREYPLELGGDAWIDPLTGDIVRIVSAVEQGIVDIGMRSLTSQVDYSPAPFADTSPPFYLPAQATVEVESPRQHWRNIHRFTDYRRFSVSTEEKVADNK